MQTSKYVPQIAFLHVQKLNISLGKHFCMCRTHIFTSETISALADIKFVPPKAFLHMQTWNLSLGKHSCTCRHQICRSGSTPARAGIVSEEENSSSLQHIYLMFRAILFFSIIFSTLFQLFAQSIRTKLSSCAYF